MRLQSISASTLLLKRWSVLNVQCSKHSVCQMHETKLVGIMPHAFHPSHIHFELEISLLNCKDAVRELIREQVCPTGSANA